jgi:hypothetical protein
VAAGDLTTADKVRTHLALKTPDADTLLAQLVSASSRWVVSQLGRPVLAATYTEVRNGNGRTRMLLDECPPTLDEPPITVTSVKVDGATIPKRAAVTEGDTSPSGWVLRAYGIDLVGHSFSRGTQNVEIVYSVGYATCPEDLEQAVIEHVALRYRDRGREGLAMAAGGGESATYTANPGGLAFINGVLERYRAIGVG